MSNPIRDTVGGPAPTDDFKYYFEIVFGIPRPKWVAAHLGLGLRVRPRTRYPRGGRPEEPWLKATLPNYIFP